MGNMRILKTSQMYGGTDGDVQILKGRVIGVTTIRKVTPLQ